ncbi:hypothetical protein GGI22_002127 [Coemansia erecta]|nr:hypothetical protein GGI22_002127 [Coemansia erecta]
MVMDERRQEAMAIAVNNIHENANGLFTLVEPECSVKAVTIEIIDTTMATINRGFSTVAGVDVDAVLSKETLRMRGKTFDLDRAVESTLRLSRLNNEECRDVSETDMYPLFRDFVMLVAHHVKSGVEGNNKGFRTKAKGKSKGPSAKISPYLILPYEGGDYKPEGCDDRRKIDGARALCEISTEIGAQGKPRYKDIVAIEELKRLKNEQRSAYVQLIKYT